MKVALLVLFACVALSQVSVSEAFFFPGFGLGLGFPFFRPWGFGFPFFRPWGFGLGLGFRRFGLGFGGRFGLRRPFIGKRDVEMEMEKTLCSFTSKNNKVKCHGSEPEQTFECDVVPHFNELKSTSYRIHNLTVIPDVVRIKKEDHQVYGLFSTNDEEELNEYTLIEKPEKEVIFHLYNSKEVKETGLRFKSENCWDKFQEVMKVPETVRFALFINRHTKNVKKAVRD